MPTFGTVCDGIGCGHLAFNRAGFDCAWSFEIEAFPSAVLAYRFPDVKNHGDMLKCAGMVKVGEIAAPDVFIGGTPCQAFSVAGKRKGLDDARGNLSLTFCRIADAVDDVRRRDGKPPCVILWENVPGVLSDKGNAFGCFLGKLSGAGCEIKPPGGKWGNAGCVFGPKRTAAFRVLDSQYYGVAQRRRRLFVMASAGEGARPEEILFEREGLRRDSPPSREKREGVTYDLAPSLTSSGRGVERAGETRGQDPVVAVCPTLRAGGNATGGHRPPGTDVDTCDSLIPVHTTGDVVTVGCLTGDHAGRPTDYTPVVAIQEHACSPDLNCGPGGKGFKEDGTAYTLEARNNVQAVAFSCKDYGNGSSENLSPTLRAMEGARPNGGGQMAVVCASVDVAHTLRGDGFDASEDGSGRGTPLVPTPAIGWSEELTASIECAGTIQRGGSGGRHEGVMTPAMQVRRLTPCECEALQGLPRNWTLIPWRGKPASECPDGPRYKAIGNGQTVTVMEWLARRIMAEMTR